MVGEGTQAEHPPLELGPGKQRCGGIPRCTPLFTLACWKEGSCSESWVVGSEKDTARGRFVEAVV